MVSDWARTLGILDPALRTAQARPFGNYATATQNASASTTATNALAVREQEHWRVEA